MPYFNNSQVQERSMMAKRRQTTGLPKQKAATQTSASQESGRVQKSRAEREAQIQRYILIGSAVGIGIIVLILVLAVVIELVITPNQVVANVNGQTITVAQFEERVRLERALLNLRINNFAALISAQGMDINQMAGQEPLRSWLSLIQLPDQLGNSVVNTMVDDTLVRQQAAAMGITVSEEDIEQQIINELGFDPEDFVDEAEVEPTETVEPTITPTPFVSPTPSPTRPPTATAEPTVEATEEATEEAQADMTPTFTPLPPTATLTAPERLDRFQTIREDYFSGITSSARISRAQLNSYYETMALREALRDAVTEIDTEVLHANARHILVATQEEALDIVSALQAGESFAALAQAASTDTGSGSQGGELGWSPVTNYVAPFAEAVENAEIGAITEPVETEFGWHIIQVRAREMREVSEAELENARNRELERWLETLKEAEETSIEINPIWADNVPDDPVFALTANVTGGQ
jgi:parvulin-like peptidyl-prolyl isomerase